MKCPNCKKQAERISVNLFECGDCDELFELKDKKLVIVKDKKAAIKELTEAFGTAGQRIKDLAEKYDVDIDDDDEGFYFA